MVKRCNKQANESYCKALGMVVMIATSGKHEVMHISDGHVCGGRSCVVLPWHVRGQMGNNGLVGEVIIEVSLAQ